MQQEERAVVLTALEVSEISRDLGSALLSGLDAAKLTPLAARLDIAAARVRGTVERMAEASVQQAQQAQVTP